jgi:hypothetical protein
MFSIAAEKRINEADFGIETVRICVMSAYDLPRYLEWFQSYIEGFYFGTNEDVANIDLKKDHSLRVLQEASMLTASLQVDSPLVDIVHIAALLHDVGRFPQYREFKTYNDRKSVNHARLGVTVMRGADILDRLLPEHRRLVLGTVFLHNRTILPARLSFAQSLIVRIIQDADKLDIIPTVMATLDPAAPAKRVVSLGLSLDPDHYSEAIYKKIARRQPVDVSEMVWLNDFKLMLLGWLPTLNFPASRKAVLERRYPERLMALLPPREELLALGEDIRSDLLNGMSAPSRIPFQAT